MSWLNTVVLPDPSGTVGCAVGSALVTAVNATAFLGGKAYAVGWWGSRALSDLYSMEGFEKLSKFVLAGGKVLLWSQSVEAFMGPGLRKAMETVENQKTLLYATMTLTALDGYVVEDKQGWLSFGKLPTLKGGGYSYSKLLQTCGALCETRRFLEKYAGLSFPGLAAFAQRTAPLQFLRWGAAPLTEYSWLDKELYIFAASLVDLKRCLINYEDDGKQITDIDNVCTIIGSLGKMALIAGGRSYNAQKWYVVIDVVTQSTSLFAYLYRQHRTREQACPTPLNKV